MFYVKKEISSNSIAVSLWVVHFDSCEPHPVHGETSDYRYPAS